MNEIFLCDTDTFLSQMIVAFVVGLILSCMSVSLAEVLLLYAIIEAFTYFQLKKIGSHNSLSRVCVLFGYITGWILGRSLYGLKTFIISREVDEMLGFC